MSIEYAKKEDSVEQQIADMAEKIKVLEGEQVSSTSINDYGEATIIFKSGKKLSFVITDEDHFNANNIWIEVP